MDAATASPHKTKGSHVRDSFRHRGVGLTTAITATATLALGGCSTYASPDNDNHHVLRLSARQAPASFAIGAYGGGEVMIQTSIFDTVLAFDMDGKIVPNLAKKFQYNKDRTSLTLDLRDDAEFSNGKAVDAQAVVDSLTATMKAQTTAGVVDVKSIKATDKDTVVITLSEPSASLVPSLAGVGGFVAEPSTIGTKAEATRPIGSGPYTLNRDETQIGEKYVLDKVENHWRADDYTFDRIEISVIPDITAAVNGLQSGQLDHVVGLSLDQSKTLKGQFATGVDNPTTWGSIWIADREGEVVPALGDARVRQAINMALDRSALKRLAPGQRDGVDQIFNVNGGAYLPELKGHYPHDVKAARELMAKAGYSDGFSVTMPSTIASADFEPFLTQSLGKIGITVKWETASLQDIVASLASKKYAMFYFPTTYSGSDALDAESALGPVFNPFGTSTPEETKLLDAANASGARDAFADLNRYFTKEAWFAPVMASTFLWAHSKSVDYTPPALWGYSVLPWSVAKG
ncbi:ABC transporter substrate-binding protein [Streptomyces shenzhenensis]|uniref:ABC transporter substrate-binding protein n=1 Tax=Streptomyces shenzhenensis TaxID=943815 RepID=UPI003690C0A7